MLSYDAPDAVQARDVCTCEDNRPGKHLTQAPLCDACAAWDAGYVLVDGDLRYLRSLWVRANQPDKGDAWPWPTR